MPVGLQRWPLTETKDDLSPQPTICGTTISLYKGEVDGALSKEEDQFGRGVHRVQDLDGGRTQDLQKKLDKLRKLTHSLEEQMTELDGKAEKAKARLEKEWHRAEEQAKRFGCIVELVQQLSCSREIEDVEQDSKIASNKDDDNTATIDKNKYEVVDEKVKQKLHFPTFLGQGSDYLEQLIQSHVPNYPITNSIGCCSSQGGDGGGRCGMLSTSNPSTECVGTSSVFHDQHITLDSKGEYVMVTNNAPNEVDLGGHLIMQTLNGRRVATFALPARVPLSSFETVTIWANGSDYKTAQPPKHFVYVTLNDWCTDANCITILCNTKGQAISWTTVVKEAPDKQPHLTSPPPFGEEEEPVIDILSYVDTALLQNKHCDKKNIRFVPFPPLRPSVHSYLPAENRCGQMPANETLYAGAPGQRMGSAPLLTTVRTRKLPTLDNGRKNCFVAPI